MNGLLVVFAEYIDYSLIDALRRRGIYCEPALKKFLSNRDGTRLAKGIVIEKCIRFQESSEYPYIHLFQRPGVNFESEVNDIVAYCSSVGIKQDWSLTRFISGIAAEIRRETHYIVSLSGGVDSSVLAVLVQQILNKPLKCIYIDTGLGRQTDRADVIMLGQQFENLDVDLIDLRSLVMDRLCGVTDSAAKKKILRHCFNDGISMYLEQHSDIASDILLLHGTLLEDSQLLFDSDISSRAIPKAAPLRHLLKREVREMAMLLGIDESVVHKLPFSSWGYARKILGEVTSDRLNMIKLVDNCLVDQLKTSSFYNDLTSADVSLLVSGNNNLFICRIYFTGGVKQGIAHAEEITLILNRIADMHSFIHKCMLDCSGHKVINSYD